MTDRGIWYNQSLGINGWLYWVLGCALVCPLFVVILFTYSIFQSGYLPWEKGVFVIGGIFFSSYLWRALVILQIAASTAKELEVENGFIVRLKTFSGKVTEPEECHFYDSSSVLEKSHLQLLFPSGGRHLALRVGQRTYYVSSSTENYMELLNSVDNVFTGDLSRPQAC